MKQDLQATCPTRFDKHDTLSALRDKHGGTRKTSALLLDGCVLLMQAPKGTFDEVVTWLHSLLERAIATAALVVVVFDEMEKQGGAKRYEQAKRDRARLKNVPVCSDDLVVATRTDAYTQKDLNEVLNLHDVIAHRPARPRLLDALFTAAFMRLLNTRCFWNTNGEPSVLLFDGLDPRGAARPMTAVQLFQYVPAAKMKDANPFSSTC